MKIVQSQHDRLWVRFLCFCAGLLLRIRILPAAELGSQEVIVVAAVDFVFKVHADAIQL